MELFVALFKSIQSNLLKRIEMGNHEHSGEWAKLSFGKAFAVGIVLNLTFVFIEIIFGFITNSSSLLADAGHNASDVVSLIFAWTAALLATRKPDEKYTYGLGRATILASILNSLLLIIAIVIIAVDAFRKINNPVPVLGNTIMVVAAIGMFINGFTAFLFMKGRKTDLNIRSIFIHLMADALISFGVVLTGLAINITGFAWIDIAMSFLIIMIILWGTIPVLLESINLALDAVPRSVDVEGIKTYLSSIEGLIGFHDLHVWALSTKESAITAHLIIPYNNKDQLIDEIQTKLREHFKIGHVTLQIEESDCSNLKCSRCES